jgi:hypothetical protein
MMSPAGDYVYSVADEAVGFVFEDVLGIDLKRCDPGSANPAEHWFPGTEFAEVFTECDKAFNRFCRGAWVPKGWRDWRSRPEAATVKPVSAAAVKPAPMQPAPVEIVELRAPDPLADLLESIKSVRAERIAAERASKHPFGQSCIK